MQKRKLIFLLFLAINLLFVLLAVGYLWHYIPESAYTGAAPPAAYNTLEGWYDFNELTGVALLFVGASNLFFMAFAGRKIANAKKLLFALLFATIVNVVVAGVAVELFLKYFKS